MSDKWLWRLLVFALVVMAVSLGLKAAVLVARIAGWY
jgi:hypothetical protein